MTSGKEKDRLDRFRAHIQCQLESCSDGVVHQTRFAEMWPKHAEEIKQELKEREESIVWLRDVIAELDQFERDEESENCWQNRSQNQSSY